MFISQFIGLVEGKEELRSVGIPLSTICHSNQTSPRVRYQLPFFHFQTCIIPVEPKPSVLFILEWFSVETLSSETCSGRITRLDDEVGYQAMKDDIIVVSYRSVPPRHLCDT